VDLPPKIKIKYSIFGENMVFDELTHLFGAEPEKTWRKGNLIIPQGPRTQNSDGWRISTQRIPEWYVDQALHNFLTQYHLPNPQISTYCQQHHYEQEIGIIIDIHDHMPSITLEPKLMKLLGQHQIELGFDMYLVGFEE